MVVFRNSRMPRLVTNREHWLARAAQMRRLAELVEDDVIQQDMLELARDYDRLAKSAEVRDVVYRDLWSTAIRARDFAAS